MSKRPSSRPPVSAEDVGQFYAKYKAPANEDFPEGVPPEKIMSLFQDMKITGDFAPLFLSWSLKAKKPFFFSKEEFIDGMTKLKVSNAQELATVLTTFQKHPEKIPKQKFAEFVGFSFKYSLDHPDDKLLKNADCCQLLQAVLNGRPHIADFVAFLSGRPGGLTLDQFTMILEFSDTISTDFSNYDDAGFYPSVFDDFVEYMQEKRAK